jgi:hypothetical protein
MPCCVSEAGAGHRYMGTRSHYPAVLCFCCALTIRGVQFEAFRPFLWHLMAALKPLPDQVNNPPPLFVTADWSLTRGPQRCTVYRGIDVVPNLAEYDGSRKIHWSGFSSTTVTPQVMHNKAKETETW